MNSIQLKAHGTGTFMAHLVKIVKFSQEILKWSIWSEFRKKSEFGQILVRFCKMAKIMSDFGQEIRD